MTQHAPDPRIQDARNLSILDVAHRLAAADMLKRAGREWVGPCPRPGCGGDDRFSLNDDKGVFHCRRCAGHTEFGADVIGLVRMVQGLTFPDALTWLMGEGRRTLTPEEQAAADRAAEQNRARKADEAEKFRRASIDAGRRIWAQGVSARDTPVAVYLGLRGISARICAHPPKSLRYHPDLPYMHDMGDRMVEVHRGPAMLAACVDPAGRVMAVHQTWIDMSAPKGKAVICDAAGNPITNKKGQRAPVKKVRGSQRRAAIRFYEQRRFETLVMGEGIETTLTARGVIRDQAVACWAGISLGHLAGKRVMRRAALRDGGIDPDSAYGKKVLDGGLRAAGIPNLSDGDGFLPPPWIKHLILIQDGDSDPVSTRAQLLSCLRRAKHHIPGLRTSIVHPGDGVDLNDLAMGVA